MNMSYFLRHHEIQTYAQAFLGPHFFFPCGVSDAFQSKTWENGVE